MRKKNLFILVLILAAAYMSYNGISYERAVIENTLLPCCENGMCDGLDCDDPCGMGVPPNEWPGTAMDCVNDGGSPYCNLTASCEYWGPGDIRCDNLTASISGPTYLTIPAKGSTATATWSANVNGGLTPYSYSWQLGGTTGSASSFSYTYHYQTPGTGVVYLTVNSSDGQSASTSKTVYFISDLDP